MCGALVVEVVLPAVACHIMLAILALAMADAYVILVIFDGLHCGPSTH